MATEITFETVRKLARSLPNVEESTTYGSPALKVNGKLLACIPSHKSAEPDSLVVCVGFERRAELLEGDSETYYVKEHYVGYPAVLVRMSRLQPDTLRDLLGMALRFVTSQPAARKRKAAGRVATRRSRIG